MISKSCYNTVGEKGNKQSYQACSVEKYPEKDSSVKMGIDSKGRNIKNQK